jgi:Transglutaminase-like superfamily
MQKPRARAALWLDLILVAIAIAGAAVVFLGWHFAVSPALAIALPVIAFAALAAAVYAVTRRAWRVAMRFVLVALAFGFAVYASLGWAGGGSAPVAQQAPQAVSAQLDGVTQKMQAADYILAERAKLLPTTDAAFAYVRDNIGFESYPGILRGAQGTFQDRAGNALDRAMMLAAILETNKIPVRIATGQLSASDAERLYARMFEATPAPSPPPSVSAEANALKDRIFARAKRDDATILAALGNALPAVAPTSHDDLIKEIQQHAWVQAQVNGQWVDLDPSFADSVAGHAYATADQTYTAPPPALMQQVTIRVITETLVNGALTKDTVLEATTPAYKIVDSQVFLTHVHPTMNMLGSKDTFEPALSVDGHASMGKPINYDAGASASVIASSAPMNQVIGAFGSPAPAAANPSAPQFVAEWLEFEIAYPDGHKETTRRAIVDRAGTAWRHASTLDPTQLKDLARNADGLIAPQTLYNMWFSAGKHDLLAYANSEQALLNGTIPSKNPNAPTFGEQVWPFGIRDLSWFIASDHMLVPAINDTPGLRFYADSPRIFVWNFGPDPSGKSSAMYMESDLRRDSLRAVAKDPAPSQVIAQHKVYFGALEGALEHEMSVPPQADASQPFVSTSSLADSGDVIALTPGAPVKATDPETQARIDIALGNLDALIVPKQVMAGGVSGWWQIAHGTGDTRAVLADDLDGSGGFTPGGYTRGPIRAPIPGGGGPTKVWHLPEDPKYYANLEKDIGGGEIGEYAETNEIAVDNAPAFKLLGATVVAVVTWAYVIFSAIGGSGN